MTLVQQLPRCSDFDVILAGGAMPAFRVLLPERVCADGKAIHPGAAHVVPGVWEATARGMVGRVRPCDDAEVTVAITCRETEIAVDLGVRNKTAHAFSHITVDICAGVNHLPGTPDWCNRDFIPSEPLDRAAQGRYWYETATPHGLKALTAEGWVRLHPRPDDPDAAHVPPYSFVLSPRADRFAAAVSSHDGGCLFFQAWDAPCYSSGPFPGNACTHLQPIAAMHLRPGQEVTIRGLIGIFEGTREALARRIIGFREGRMSLGAA